MLQTGDQTGDVGLITLFKMGDQANATQLLMQMRRALAVPQVAGAEIVMLTANVLDALTSGVMARHEFSMFYVEEEQLILNCIYLRC